MSEETKLIVRGARAHNLKGVNLTLPLGKLIMFSGVSGSGKSSLAFETIFKEAQRRYLETYSAHAKQFMGKLGQTGADHISGLPPAISISQGTLGGTSRSTVGTITGLHDLLRLLFSRTATPHPDHLPPGGRLLGSNFSFNSVHGQCGECRGLGLVDRLDPDLIVADPSATLRSGALVPQVNPGYIMYSQVTMDVLDQVCRAHDFNVDTPWQELSEDQQQVIWRGSERIRIPFGKHPLENRLKWSGITAKPREEGFYKGILTVMEEILKRDRNKNILKFVSSAPCPSCRGTRLSPIGREATLQGRTISWYSELGVSRLIPHLEEAAGSLDQARGILEEMARKIRLMESLGLGHLTLSRASTSLSGGEAGRLRLVSQLSTGLQGVLYVLDEPSVGLHPRDQVRLLACLTELRDLGNTVLVVEHEPVILAGGDLLVELGPGPGPEGGEITWIGPPRERLPQRPHHPDIQTWKDRVLGRQTRPGSGRIQLRGARANNLDGIDVDFARTALNVITGVSGAGKTTLAIEVLAGRLSKPGTPGAEGIDRVLVVDQSPVGKTSRSNPATYSGVFDSIRDLFAGLDLSVERGWGKARFSFNLQGGRCETCQGAGVVDLGLQFMSRVATTCPDCEGARFDPATLEVEFQGKNISQVLALTIDQARELFEDQPRIRAGLDMLSRVGLGYITLGQPTPTLSGGESQRLRLAAELTGSRGLIILDEPCSGLHLQDRLTMLEVVDELVDQGNTVVVVEQEPLFLLAADWVVDLGPESGDRGGRVLSMGPPEALLPDQDSPSAEVLRAFLQGRAPLTPQPEAGDLEPNRQIQIRGARQNNLKSLDLDLPHRAMTVITGVSGSGKSSLAMDTIFAEGQNRFTESLSTHARRFIRTLPRPEVASISGLTPPIAIGGSWRPGPRSTLATMTDIHPYLRLLFSRLGQAPCPACGLPGRLRCRACGEELPGLPASAFSFNREGTGCPTCDGLGIVRRCPEDLLVTNPELGLWEGALRGTRPGAYFGDPHGQHLAILDAVARARGLDLKKPWQDLTGEARDLALHGAGSEEFDAIWRFNRSGREGEHPLHAAWPGLLNLVEQELALRRGTTREPPLLALTRPVPCPDCLGTRLSARAREVTLNNQSLADLSACSIAEARSGLAALLSESGLPSDERRIARQPVERVLERLDALSRLGLSYLSLDRGSESLSSGESRRVLLAGQLVSETTGVTYILDEPTLGLHHADLQGLLEVLQRLKQGGNTLVVVEHEPELMEAADLLVELGPGSGFQGGRITAMGTPEELKRDPGSLTGSYLKRSQEPRPTRTRSPSGLLRIRGASANNLKNLDLDLPCGTMTFITGVSGSGKTSLALGVLLASLTAGAPVGCRTLDPGPITRFHGLGRRPLSGGAASSPASLLGISDRLRNLFSQTPLARERGWKAAWFSPQGKGACPACRGLGRVRMEMDFISDVWITCETCGGTRFLPETREILWKGLSLDQVLNLTVREAQALLHDHKQTRNILETMKKVGLGHLVLGQGGDTLSGGEVQRLRLVREMLQAGATPSLFILDEPSSGLHFQDVDTLMDLLGQLTDAGNTLVIIEHDPRMMLQGDHLIDLGPGAADQGGQVIFQGPPEVLMKTGSTPTARALRKAAGIPG